MSEQIHEKVGDKVGARIAEDARQAVKKAIETVRENLTGKSFRKEDVSPYIRDGARKAISEDMNQ